jgi:predicted chitinase
VELKYISTPYLSAGVAIKLESQSRKLQHHTYLAAISNKNDNDNDNHKYELRSKHMQLYLYF